MRPHLAVERVAQGRARRLVHQVELMEVDEPADADALHRGGEDGRGWGRPRLRARGIGAEVSTWMAYWSPDAGAAAPGVMLANRVAAVGCAEPASTPGRTANAMTTPTPATAILRVRTSMQRASMAASSREHPGLSWPGPHRRTELAAGSG